MCLKRHSSTAANSPSRSPKPGCWATKTPIVWASASTLHTPGRIGWPGKWPWKNHSVAVTDFSPTIRLASTSYSTIRSTRRNGQRCGISFSIWRVVRMISLATGSVTGRLLVSGGDVSAVAGGDEWRAADSVEEAGRHLAIDEDLVGQNGAMQLGVGGEAIDEQFAQRGVAPSDGLGPIGRPDAELAEETVVVGRDLIAPIQV